MSSILADLKVRLHLILYEVDGVTRFHVHALVDGSEEATDVTDQYLVAAAVDPVTGQQGFMVMKKQQPQPETKDG